MPNSHFSGAQRGDFSALRAMSFNIRYDNPGDGLHDWAHRRERVASILHLHRPDVLGLQEGRLHQIADLARTLSEFAWLGVGRDDGASRGEFAAIFYRLGRLALLDKGNFWLSKTSDVPGSINWDACCIRIVTWAKFFDRATHQEFFFFNTHFDQASKKARQKSAELVLERLPSLAGSTPLLLTGDLNCDDASKPYRILTQGLGAWRVEDARTVSAAPHHGPTTTYHGFDGIYQERIDYIFVANGIRVLRHATLADHWDDVYASDHCPVMADVVIASDAH
ncbi:MAG: endonuclease/exonuclease/phosphatase family protein [Anaerolineae bacterium]|nr:endonuclease/exonuclease/phosphatase family protein [Anaerolineae bacterium]